MTVLVDRAVFSTAVEHMLIAMVKAKDSDGNVVAIHVTPFRMAMELRAALHRALPTPMDIEVEGWPDILVTMKVPFPPDGEKQSD